MLIQGFQITNPIKSLCLVRSMPIGNLRMKIVKDLITYECGMWTMISLVTCAIRFILYATIGKAYSLVAI